MVFEIDKPSHPGHQISGHSEWDTWIIVEFHDVITHDSLLHYVVHYVMDCESLIVIHDASPNISI